MESIATIQRNPYHTSVKPRAVLLYRASSKKQTDSENDIPLQRNILKPWAERQGYDFLKEFVEGGISGFKVSAAKRDALIEIKAMAERREFDILGIYMSDRLGRIADETPLIVSYLNARGIKVISYTEGEITAHTHADKLMTYIRYWQAEGESLKTSARVCDANFQKVKSGKWRGGSTPFGYKSVSRGSLNYKGKPVFDIEIDEEESNTVRLIYQMYTTDNYGILKIAHHLNDKNIPTKGKSSLWNAGKISAILNNKIYYGVYELYKESKEKESFESPVIQDLVIIDKEIFDKAQSILKKNRKAEFKFQRPTVHGKLLLSGLLYCGECGKKFTSHNHSVGKGRDGKTRIYTAKYRCSSFATPKTRVEKCHQKLYKAEELDRLVIADSIEFISTLDKDRVFSNYKSETETKTKDAIARYEKCEKDLAQKEKELAKLKDEVMKVILGTSSFSQELLTEMIHTKDKERAIAIEALEQSQLEIMLVDQQTVAQVELMDELNDWAARFNSQPTEQKKSMLINIIDKIVVNGNDIEITYKVGLHPLTGLKALSAQNINQGVVSLACHGLQDTTQTTHSNTSADLHPNVSGIDPLPAQFISTAENESLTTKYIGVKACPQAGKHETPQNQKHETPQNQKYETPQNQKLGKNTKAIKDYIANQYKNDKQSDQAKYV